MLYIQVNTYLTETDKTDLTSYNQPHAKETEADPVYVTPGETPTYLEMTDMPKQVNQLDSRPPMPLADSGFNYETPITTATTRLLSNTSASSLQQEGHTHNPTVYMALNPHSMDSQSTYMANTARPGHKEPNMPDEVEEVYETPLLQDSTQVEEVYDVIPDMKQAPVQQNGNQPSEESLYYTCM